MFACYGVVFVLASLTFYFYDAMLLKALSRRVQIAFVGIFGLVAAMLYWTNVEMLAVVRSISLALFVAGAAALLAERLVSFESERALTCITLGFLLSFSLSLLRPVSLARNATTFAMPVIICMALLIEKQPKNEPASMFEAKPTIPIRFILTTNALIIAGNLLVGLVTPGMAEEGSPALYLSSCLDVCIGIAILVLIKVGMGSKPILFWCWFLFSLMFFAGAMLMTCPSYMLVRTGSDVVTTFRVAIEYLLFALIVVIAKRERIAAMGPIGLFLLAPFGISILLRHVAAFFLVEKLWFNLSSYLPPIVMLVALLILFFQYSFANKMSFSEYFDPSATTKEMRLNSALDALCAGRNLTPREYEVLSYTARGFTMRATSEKLFISIDTVRTHTKSIFRKLNVHSRQEIIDYVSSYPDAVKAEKADTPL